ncbi:MAG TPA: 4-hydroxy-3-methylbut-2-enyl diphosphate reductase [Bacteroidales bacterium]|jgi:4-hydroxy-3-methylbut-2-enyl diphosphate reductase|nr:4-hydroxy-3-methylbut-2-enyl diphosphate reductase [Bacteroidales bacterium]
MKVEIDPKAGFCFGVTRVVNKAEEIIREQGKLFCLGEIVHNQKEIERLERIGLKTITYDEYFKLSDCRVLIRAHGEPPATYKHAKENNIELIDGTCPIVLKLQSRIKQDYNYESESGAQIVIFGKKDHAEVRGLAGQTDYRAIIVESAEDMDKIDFSRTVHLYAQTTMSADRYGNLQHVLIERAEKNGLKAQSVKCTNSICRQVSGRIDQLRDFSSRYDVILFVSYQQSSNGRLLYSKCLEVNPRTYFVTEVNDMNEEWFNNASSVGITGATSTPAWLLEEFREKLAE